MIEKKYTLLEGSMRHLKSLRQKCIEFENVLSFSLDENGENGIDISRGEFNLLQHKLTEITGQANKVKLALREAIDDYHGAESLSEANDIEAEECYEMTNKKIRELNG